MILRISPIITCLIIPPILLSWCGEVTNRSINLCFLTFWQESSNLSCMRLMKWRYCCIFVSKIIHGSHFRSCLSWDFTRAKKIIHNDDKRNGMIAYNWCIYLFLNHKFPNRQRTSNFCEVVWWLIDLKSFFRKKIFFPLLCFTIIFTLSISIFVLYLYKWDLLFSFW